MAKNNDMPGKGFPVVPSDSENNFSNGLFVGVGGDVAVVMRDDEDDNVLVHKNVPNGQFMPISVKKVMNTNTSATNIIGYKI